MTTRKDGFTLVEILVVLTLLGVLFIAGYAGLRDFSRRQALESVKRSVQGDIRLTQQLALTGKKTDTCSTANGYTLDAYAFYIPTGGTTYNVGAICTKASEVPPTISCQSAGGDLCNKIVTLTDKRVTISSDVVNPIIFKVLGQGTNITTPVVITLRNVDSGGTTTITVKSGGEIE